MKIHLANVKLLQLDHELGARRERNEAKIAVAAKKNTESKAR